MLSELLQEILLTESVSTNDINDAMDNHKRVIINYHSNGDDVATGARVIEVYAYGLTKAGNPVIRAFQPYGDTTSRVPSWKFFRLDRISAWKETNQTFSKPASEVYKGLGEFNPDDDRTMSLVYKITSFGNDPEKLEKLSLDTNPKLKPELFKTDTERGMERLKQQVDNPIKLSDIKTKDMFKNFKDTPTSSGPRLKSDGPKTDNTDSEITDLRSKLGDTSDRITMKDLNDRLLQNRSEEQPKDGTEREMEQQVEDPKMTDYGKLPEKDDENY